MNELLSKHPDLKDLLRRDYVKTYKVLDGENNLVEQWEKNDEGHWIDVTEREKLKEQIALEQEELERLNNKILKRKGESDE